MIVLSDRCSDYLNYYSYKNKNSYKRTSLTSEFDTPISPLHDSEVFNSPSRLLNVNENILMYEDEIQFFQKR